MDDEAYGIRTATAHEIGQKLDDLSLDDLDRRIEALRAEIERLEAARSAKQAALAAAGSIFRL